MRMTWVLVLGLTLAAPGLAWAKSVDAEVSRLAKQSQAQYQAGDYTAAAETLLKAYELKPVSRLLFNIAKTYEKADNGEQAMRFYQRYIDASDAEPELVRQASRAIERLRMLDDQKKAAAQADADKKAAAQKAEEDKLAAQKADLEKQQAQAAKDEADRQARANELAAAPPPKRSRAIPYTLIGVGGAALAGGAVLGITANGLASDEKASTDPFAKPDLRSQAKSRALVADIAYGVGIAALATGIIMIATEPKAPAPADGSASASSSPAHSLTPQFLMFDHGAGVALGGSL